MTQSQAEQSIRERFWKFHNELAANYQEFFDTVVSDAQDHGTLWEVLEFADQYLQLRVDKKGSEVLLETRDYIEALQYGYSEWIK